MLGGAILLFISLLLRLVPDLNDKLSGAPGYMEKFANTMAPQIAATLHDEYPVLVVREEELDCRSVNQQDVSDYYDALYMLSFSEKAWALCLTVYAKVSGGANFADTTIIPADIGMNYGRPFSAQVRAVALQRNLTVFTPEYLALLHWRTKVDPSGRMAAGRTERFTNPSATITFADLSVGILDLRAEFAKRHTAINRILLGIIVLTAGALASSSWRLWVLYRRSVQYCRSYEFDLHLRGFLTTDIAALGEHIQTAYNQRQQQLYAQARAENLLGRAKEEMRRRLEALLALLRDDNHQQLIQGCLARDEWGEMRAVLTQLQVQAAQRTPEERLGLLLESLKEYCSSDEIERCSTEAFDVLSKLGFRQGAGLRSWQAPGVQNASKGSGKETGGTSALPGYPSEGVAPGPANLLP